MKSTILKRSLLAAAACLFTACATSNPIGKPVPVAAGEEIRSSLQSAQRLMVYEGLPHQAHEKELIAREIVRKDTTRLHGYPFYTPARPAKQAAGLRRVLGSADSYKVYGGPKTCGGFHPDYAVSWNDGAKSYQLLVCFGCGEVLATDGATSMPFSLKNPVVAELRGLLDGHSLKRPRGAP